MTEPLPVLIENSLQVAWDYLDGIGELADQQQTAEFLLRNIQSQMLRGERRTLMLSNRAIESYRKQTLRKRYLIGREIEPRVRPRREEACGAASPCLEKPPAPNPAKA